MAALVGIVALAAALFVEVQGQIRNQRIASELSDIHTSIAEFQTALTLLTQQAAKGGAPAGAGASDALAALQKRVEALETGSSITGSTGTTAVPAATSNQAALGAGPTEDCIPVDTRFMAVPDEAYPICRTKQVVKLINISGEGIVLDTGAAVIPGGVAKLGKSTCTMSVISADAAGFAELKVSCT